MAQQARVTSIAGLEAFRASLVRYLEHAGRALDETTGEVQRTRGWLEGDRRRHWDLEVKRAERALEQAEADLYSASLATVRTSDSFRKLAVLKARRRLAEAAERRQQVKRWRERFDQRTDPLLRQLAGLQDKVARELPDAVVYLSEAIRTLEAYAGTRPAAARRPAAATGVPTDDAPQAPDAGGHGKEVPP
jgi:hypothetical protein